MKNAKVALKFTLLIVPLFLLTIFTVVLLAQQSTGIYKTSKTTYYDKIAVSAASILNADRDFYQAALSEKELYLSSSLTENEREALIADYNENVQQTYDRVTAAIDNLKGDDYLYSSFRHPDANVTLKELYERFTADFEKWKGSYDNSAQTGDMKAHQASFSAARDSINLMGETLSKYGEYFGTDYSRQISAKITGIVIVLCVITVLVGVFALSLVRYLNGSIKYVTGVNKRLATGDFSVSVDKKRVTKDELGELCAATDAVVSHLRGYEGYIAETVEVLKRVTSGHLWINLKQDFNGEFEVLKYALFQLSDTFNAMLTGIAETAVQVNEGAGVLSSAAQTIAQGATEQASSIQELSASITELSQNVSKNAEDAEKAKALSTEAARIMQDGVGDMELTLRAMEEISATSRNIEKVIKTIDDIAFQTNILALNAAVEAARAGAAGKGFAVVADEVRNLAQKSAEAAKNTAALIEGSIGTVEKGAALVNKTSTGFTAAAAKSSEAGKLVENISDQVREQATAISQLSVGVEQVSSVVQTNSAVAEENAASSEELSAQATSMRNAVARFELYEVK